MKRDGRKLPHATLEEMRLTALERMKQGETPSEVATAFGLHRSWAYKVLTKARGRGRGKRALLSSKGTGRPRKLTTAREWQIFKWLNGKSPYQHGLGFTLWSRQSVGDLIERKWGIHLSLASIGGLLIHLGLRPRKPLWWIGDEAPEAMTRWRAEIYPEIMRKARRENAELCFWEESDFRVDTVLGKRKSAEERTPAQPAAERRQCARLVSAANSKGGFWLAAHSDDGDPSGESLVSLLRQIMKGRRKRLHLVLDDRPAHKSQAVRDYVDSLQGKLTLHFLPADAPDSGSGESA